MKKTASVNYLMRSARPCGKRGSASADGGCLEERAAQIVAAISDDLIPPAYAASQLLQTTAAVSTAHAAGLYRAVQETGLLIPMGEPAFTSGATLSQERMSSLMAHAADQVAASLAGAIAAARRARTANARPLTTSSRPYRVRTSGPNGTAIWATAILKRDEIGEAEIAGPDAAQQSWLLGVWVLVTVPLEETSAKKRGGPKPLTDVTRRLQPFYRLLVRQVVSREALDLSKRQTEKRLREVATIYEIGKAIDQTDSNALFDLITQKAASVMDAQVCSLLIKDPDNDLLIIAASSGLTDEVVRNTRIEIGDGIAGLVAQTGDSLMIHSDARLDTRLQGRRIVSQPGVSSSICMPMGDEDNQVHGVLCIRRQTPAPPFTREDERLFSIFASQASLAIRNARLYTQMERQVRELNVLYTSSRTLTTTYGLSRACAAVNRVAVEVTGSDAALLLLFNERLDSLRVRHDLGLSSDLRDMVRLLSDSRDVNREIRLLREPVELKPLHNEHDATVFGTRWAPLLVGMGERYSALILVPLVTEEVNVGFLLLGRASTSSYRSEEEKLVSIVSSQAAAVLRNAALYEHSVDQRVLELSALYELSKKVRSARSFQGALESILEIVVSVVWCDEASFHVVDSESGLLRLEAHRGGTRRPEKTTALETHTIASWVVRERKALLSSDITADARFARTQTGSHARSLMAIPVFLGEESLAVLEVASSAVNLYTEENVKMISLIAAQAAALYREMESFRELTTYTENILRSIAGGVVTLDTQGKVVTYNAAAERILPLSSPVVIGQSFESIIAQLQADQVDQDDTRKMVQLAVETGQTVQRHQLHYYRGSERESVILNGSASRLLNERSEYLGVVLVFEDITKEHEMEQELVRIGRLAEIGELAAGIAHELRNPLASIKGAAQVVLRDLAESDGPVDLRDNSEFLEIIVDEVDVLNGVASEFLEFSRFAPPLVLSFDLNILIEKRIQFLRPEFEKCDIAVREDYDDQVSIIEGDANQLERVFTNVILNAVQAMQDGGLLTITTRRLLSQREEMVEVSFTDTGLGMSQSQIEKIFTPFFTTKTKGTGLGLAIVQKTVDAHGGRVHVTSAQGKGATFSIVLPVHSTESKGRSLPGTPVSDISTQRQQAAIRLANKLPVLDRADEE